MQRSRVEVIKVYRTAFYVGDHTFCIKLNFHCGDTLKNKLRYLQLSTNMMEYLLLYIDTAICTIISWVPIFVLSFYAYINFRPWGIFIILTQQAFLWLKSFILTVIPYVRDGHYSKSSEAIRYLTLHLPSSGPFNISHNGNFGHLSPEGYIYYFCIYIWVF